MDLLMNVLGRLALTSVTLLGITGSGFLAARRMREANELEPSTGPTERKTES